MRVVKLPLGNILRVLSLVMRVVKLPLGNILRVLSLVVKLGYVVCLLPRVGVASKARYSDRSCPYVYLAWA